MCRMSPMTGNDARIIVTDDLVQTITREAEACEPSVYRRLLRLPVRGRAGARIDRVLAAHGLIQPTDPKSTRVA